MAKTTDATTENKRKYAYAVLSGVMTRKDAYLTFINPYCKNSNQISISDAQDKATRIYFGGS